MMKDDDVQRMLAFELEKSRERNLKDSDEIIERLKEEALGDIHGATAGSRVKALELLMRHFNMLDQNQKIELSMKDSWFDNLDLSASDSDDKKNHLNWRSSQKCHPQKWTRTSQTRIPAGTGRCWAGYLIYIYPLPNLSIFPPD